MPKISVLFKPQKSWISATLMRAWYYEFNYSDFKQRYDWIYKKIKIDNVPFDDIENIYNYCRDNLSEECIVVLMCKIWDLFE